MVHTNYNHGLLLWFWHFYIGFRETNFPLLTQRYSLSPSNYTRVELGIYYFLRLCCINEYNNTNSDSTQENNQWQEEVVLIYTVKDIIGNALSGMTTCTDDYDARSLCIFAHQQHTVLQQLSATYYQPSECVTQSGTTHLLRTNYR